MRFAAGLLTAGLVFASARCAPAQRAATLLDRYDFSRRTARHDLPGRLGEISGLAFTPDGRLFAHGDERGRVHEIDPSTGEVGKRFSLGDDDVRDDFEGIAIAGERFFLVSSRGLLYEFREVGDRESTPYRVTDLGVGADCEVEGLDYDASRRMLLAICKTVSAGLGAIVVHRIPLDPGAPRPGPIRVPGRALAPWSVDEVHPSAIALDPHSGTLVLVAARQELILEIDMEGRVLAVLALSKDRHGQSEGVAFGPDGTLFIADEQTDKDARITLYAPREEAGRS